MDLLHIWPPVDSEITLKIKFAKYHALRIAKALKAGEDPNLSNPSPEANDGENPQLDSNDPEVQALHGSKTHQATVEEAPDEQFAVRSDLHPSLQPDLSSPSQATSAHIIEGQPASATAMSKGYTNTLDGEVSPLDPPEKMDYFPTVPEGYSNENLVLPEAPPNQPGLSLPPTSPSDTKLSDQPVAQPDSATPIPTSSAFASIPTGSSHLSSILASPPSQSSSQPTILPSSSRSPAALGRVPPSHAKSPISFVPDEEAIAKAQKHARWAISALNFEDISTAVSELRGALRTLGAE